MKRAVVSIMVMGLMLCMAGQTMAVPVASESFDYLEGKLVGSEGGSGWSEAWQGGVEADNILITWPGLEYADSKGKKLSVAGQAIRTGGKATRKIDLARPELAPFVQDGTLGADGTTIWIGFLAHMNKNDAWDYIDLRAAGVTKMVMGRESTVPNWGLGSFAEVEQQGKTSIDKDVFFVVRIDFKTGDDTVYLWTNPDLDIEPAVRNADITTSRDVAFDSVWLHGCGQDVRFDELRIGTFWEDLIGEVEEAAKDDMAEEKETDGAEAEPQAAMLIASDSFDYPEGNLTDNNGGSGWENPWYDVHPGGTPKSFVLSPGLEYIDSEGKELPVAGGQVGIAYDTSRIINLDTEARKGLARYVKNGALGADGTTIWISLLAFSDEGGEAWSLVELREGEDTEKLKIGHAGGSANWSFIDTDTKEGKTPLTEQAFVVLRIDFKSSRDDIYLWTNPDLGAEPAVEKADARSAARDVSFNTIVLRGDANDEVYIDELRIGTTWADVSK